MIKNRNIVCVSYTTWYGPYTKSTVQVLSRLAQNNRLVFVEYPFTLKDIVTTLIGKKNAPIRRMLGLKQRIEVIDTEVNSQVYQLISPPMFPVDFIKNDSIFSRVFKINSLIYQNVLKRTLKKLNFENPIIINAFNAMYGLPLIGNLNEALNIYYCYDGIETRRHGPRIFKIDEDFSKAVDGIITSSEYLDKGKKKMNANSFVVKNGVDYTMFIAEAKEDVFNGRQHKKIGYIGSLDHRFDIDTMEYCIQNMPETKFEFTGDLRNKKIQQKLDTYSNTEFFPPIGPHEVPKLLATYDLGVIPYLVNDVNKNIYPLKINEYFAVGVPVVLTAFAKLPEFEKSASFANNKEDFLKKIKEELNNDSKAKIEERKSSSENNSWDKKAIEFGEIIETLVNSKDRILLPKTNKKQPLNS